MRDDTFSTFSFYDCFSFPRLSTEQQLRASYLVSIPRQYIHYVFRVRPFVISPAHFLFARLSILFRTFLRPILCSTPRRIRISLFFHSKNDIRHIAPLCNFKKLSPRKRKKLFFNLTKNY